MNFFVYIIKSDFDGTFYKGFSTDPLKRLFAHNNAESQFTSSKIPWSLVAVFVFDNKKSALIFERKIKKYSRDKILLLINREDNMVHSFTQ